MSDLYKIIEVETEVMDAHPHRLVQMLFERCVQEIQLGRLFMEKNDVSKKSKSIAKAMDILAYLKMILNKDDGDSKELSEKLDLIYTYASKNLTKAHLKNDVACLDAALNQVTKIKTAWDAISEKAV